MKKLILALALLASVPAFAQHRHHGHHGGYRGPGVGWWVAPVITGVIGYEIARSQQPVIVQQQPVIVQNPSPIYQPNQNCTVWKEIQSQDGTIYRERTCTQ